MGNEKVIFLIIFAVVFLVSLVSAGCPPEMVAYWKLDANPQTHLGTVADDSGNGNTGTFYTNEGPTNKAVPGKLNFSLNFDGINDYIEIPNNESLNPTQELSVEAWVNPVVNNNNLAVIVKKSDATQKNGYTLEGSSTVTKKSNTFRFVVYNGKCLANASIGIPEGWCSTGSTPPLIAGEWHHLVGTYNGTELKLYLNGNLISTVAVSGNISVSINSLMIGKDPSNPTVFNRFFRGRIDEVAIYNKSLTKEEVYKLYQNSSGGHDYCESLCSCSSGPCCDGCNYLPAGTDCGICAVCDGNGANEENCVYDETQDFDCSATECPDSCTIDNNPYTWDYAEDVPNECAAKGNCSKKECGYNHECRDNDPDDGVNGDVCGAECDQNEDCEVTECDYLDGCVGVDYYNYDDVDSNCLESCECEENECGDPTIYYNDPRCTECQTDDECCYLNKDYCGGDVIKHDEGKCVNYKCEIETIELEDCNQRDGIIDECGLMDWECGEEIDGVVCVIKDIEPQDELCPDFCCEGDIKNDGVCNPITYDCDYIAEDCNDYNNDYCNGSLVKQDDYSCQIVVGNNDWVPFPPEEVACVLDSTSILKDCNDGLYCNGQETCDNAQCMLGISIDCSANDLILIETCDNNSDNNPFTWDYRQTFTSVCDEDNDKCTTGDSTITHTCDIEKCGAECKEDGDCGLSETCNLDTCECEATCIPEEEVCDGVDNDCDSLIDEDCECTIGETRYCPFQGGVCKGSIEKCTSQGKWPGCDYSLIPYYETTESTCNDLRDNDCDSLIDINDPNCIICVDNDKDGYDAISPDCPTGNDCDDADNTIYPGAKEISDGKDNDCDGSIDEGIIKQLIDKLPRQKFLISKIRTNKVEYDEIKAGDLLFVDLTFENIGRQNTKYATIRITIPELGISRKLGPFNGPEIDEVMSRGLYLEIPEDAKPGVYSVRISLSDISGIRRTRHRDFRIVK